jgi:hypothetical protein
LAGVTLNGTTIEYRKLYIACRNQSSFVKGIIYVTSHLILHGTIKIEEFVMRPSYIKVRIIAKCPRCNFHGVLDDTFYNQDISIEYRLKGSQCVS